MKDIFESRVYIYKVEWLKNSINGNAQYQVFFREKSGSMVNKGKTKMNSSNAGLFRNFVGFVCKIKYIYDKNYNIVLLDIEA